MLEAEGYEQVAYMATCLHIVVVMAYVAPFTPEHFSATSAMAQQYMAVLTLSVHFGPDSCFYSQLSILSSPIISRNQGPMSGADLPLVHLLHLLLDSLTHPLPHYRCCPTSRILTASIIRLTYPLISDQGGRYRCTGPAAAGKIITHSKDW